MGIFEQYGIKEVADVCIYSIHKKQDNSGDVYYVPALYLDTLKVSSVEKTAENVWAQGGLGNSRLVCWDYGKQINLTLEDALCTPASLGLCWGGVLGADWKDGKLDQKLGITWNTDKVEKLERMEKAFYPRNNKETSTISYLLPQTAEDRKSTEINGIITNSEVVDGTNISGYGMVKNHSYKWKLYIESDIKTVATVPNKFFDIYGKTYRIDDTAQVIVNSKPVNHKFHIIYKLDKGTQSTITPEKTLIIDTKSTTSINTNSSLCLGPENPFKSKTVTYTWDLEDSHLPEIAYIKSHTTIESSNGVKLKESEYKNLTVGFLEEENKKIGWKITGTLQADNSTTAILYKLVWSNFKPRAMDVYYKGATTDQLEGLDTHHPYINDAVEIKGNKRSVQVTFYNILTDIEYDAVTIQGISLPDNFDDIDGILDPEAADYLIIVIDNDNNYFAYLGNKPGESDDNTITCKIPKIPIDVEQFKGLDLWLNFENMNELIYFLLTKYANNINYIRPASIIEDTNNIKQTIHTTSEDNGRLWAYINPRTMQPYPDDYWFHQGEPYYIKSITLAQRSRDLKAKRITVPAGQFPGMYMIVGETYIRNRDTGEDERLQIKFPLCKIKSNQTLTLQAEGDPTTFNLEVEVARPVSGIMMEMTSYEVDKKVHLNEHGELEVKDGSTEVLRS